MKREGYIFDRIVCPLNIRRAIKNASKHKHHKRVVERVMRNAEAAALEIRKILMSGFTASRYREMTVFDGATKKQRLIQKPKFFPDQIVHWALVQQIQPVMMRGMHAWSCGSIPGRGQHRCKQGVERWLRNDPQNTRYCLKLDISKFYQSVDNDILKRQFRRVIKDAKTLQLIDAVIDSTQGLSIGNYTSQWFANFYLQGADHFVAEKLRHYERKTKRGAVKRSDAVVYYARYVDDMVLFGRNKKYLRWARDLLFHYLSDNLHLTVKQNWQLFLVSEERRKPDGTVYTAGRDVDFLGYRMNHTHTTLRRRLSLRIARRARKIGKKPTPTGRDAAAMISYNGYLRHSDSKTFEALRVKPYVDLEKLKGVIASDCAKKRRDANAQCG